jgi:hypothetical protein
MPLLTGGCHCGNITVSIELSSTPGTYHPRACDCDFCRKHGAAWVSDPQGSLAIRICEERAAARYAQGAGIAEMLLCRRCGVLVAALWAEPRLYGVVNTGALDARSEFAQTQAVSPKELSSEAKMSRWRSIWFARVSLTKQPDSRGEPPC